MITQLSLKTLEYDGLNAPSLRGFEWHTKNQVHWLALVDVLGELQNRDPGADIERAWKLVQQIYDTHPEILRRGNKPLFRALNSMVLSAWTKHAADYEQKFDAALQIPGFIAVIQQHRQRKKQRLSRLHGIPTPDTHPSGDTYAEQAETMTFGNENIGLSTNDMASFQPMDMDATLFNPIDWDQASRSTIGRNLC